ncbi:hypothetical protein FPANT_9031 [Fusarium pseudoanthophilum]|uniref:Uncharacterized protein n=1 Tax=Fusarium pseudoanthophilum TaxID=48495 RepID=A0A8H5KV96_9HYPO|nr:hypothetical protein FPANT_9031 [Fusarium pseudoanthophilum]
MSDIPRINSSSKRKNREGHEVMQNPEASSHDIPETSENTDDVSGAAKKNGNSIDNDSPPAKKKPTRRRIPIKDKPRKLPCMRCISRMAHKGYKHFCCSPARLPLRPGKSAFPCYDCARLRSSCKDPVGEAAELRKQLQKFARHIVDSQSAGDVATEAEWRRRATAAKAFLIQIREMPSVAPDQESQSVSEEPEPAPSNVDGLPRFDGIQPSSNVPTHPIQSGQQHMAPPQDASVPGGFAAPQNLPVFQDIPADLFMDPQGNFFQDISQDGPGPFNNQPQCPFRRLESTLNRIAAGVEANNSLMQQILARGGQNTNNPINFNR